MLTCALHGKQSSAPAPPTLPCTSSVHQFRAHANCAWLQQQARNQNLTVCYTCINKTCHGKAVQYVWSLGLMGCFGRCTWLGLCAVLQALTNCPASTLSGKMTSQRSGTLSRSRTEREWSALPGHVQHNSSRLAASLCPHAWAACAGAELSCTRCACAGSSCSYQDLAAKTTCTRPSESVHGEMTATVLCDLTD